MVALSTVNADSAWLINTLEELGLSRNRVVLCDNEGALKTVRNPALLEGTKHVRKTAHFVKQYYELGLFELDYVNTKDNVVDLLTKALTKPAFARLFQLGNLID